MLKKMLIAMVLSAGIGAFAAAKMENGMVTIPADQGKITAPLEIKNGVLIGKVSGSVVYEFEVDADGDYVLWSKAAGPDGNSDSYFFFIDSMPEQVWDVKITKDKKGEWQNIRGREKIKDGVVKLTKGPHTLTLKGREANAIVEKICIAKKGQKPQE